MYLYRDDGKKCICDPDQIEKMKALGYKHDKDPKKQIIENKNTPSSSFEEIPKKKKKKKDIVL